MEEGTVLLEVLHVYIVTPGSYLPLCIYTKRLVYIVPNPFYKQMHIIMPEGGQKGLGKYIFAQGQDWNVRKGMKHLSASVSRVVNQVFIA